MNFNATLIGQMITFGLLVLFTMKYVWPPIIQAMQDRQKRIADGLASAERGMREQELAKAKAAQMLKEAKQQATEIIAQAQKRANEAIEQSKLEARAEGDRQLVVAKTEIEQEVNRAREQLRSQVISLAVAGASKVLKREVDEAANAALLDDLIAQL
ncbi:MAG: F0F1 ATP synthase subunit B [Candidatus Competibacteraceae bacterium]|uniref:ATP synthase subunit b n=1 Tax=Candidatus Contendobacter odensis Run_B_J11 TaxID=1400861 RepID=A0A7U7J4Q6_9GAMM|nr:F0F1 ATP synthase subunit B [Candidatus Contendobacter odensis]MBK8536596.1 F0F1 ATP synthase subunit B [Candidatus Competibacteraceae bacterium]MBK8753126.1 F0F1 ATP synthase subunit B [Candidatus Competibacteraceae bacterium]CDH47530.1 membrane-bound ATP synthase, F0 sector, subunit b [Candidatus Contendobacter odensis Run_B_J11]